MMTRELIISLLLSGHEQRLQILSACCLEDEHNIILWLPHILIKECHSRRLVLTP